MTYFLKSGIRWTVSSKEQLDLHEELPAGNYVIKQNEMTGQLYLEQIESFEVTGKLYGDTVKNTHRILSTFNDRDSGTGVMLAGEKGSGKSLLAKNISYEAYKQGIPTIVINSPWCGDKFNAFIQSIEQPCIIMFDEYEKIYDNDDQEKMLTLLDGVFPSKKLFILTCNDKWRVNQHMRNRPGRIFYMLDFKGLSAEFIREYCQDKLNDKEHIERIVQIAGTFDQFNFDMLKALVEEMNRYNETPQESMRMLNTKPEFSNESKYNVKILINGNEIEENKLDTKEWRGNPLQSGFAVDYKCDVDSDDDDDSDWQWERVSFTSQDLKKIEMDGTRYIFIDDEGNKAVLSKIKEKDYRYWDAF